MEEGRRSRRRGVARAAASAVAALAFTTQALGACRSPEPSAGAHVGSLLASLLATADLAHAPWRCAADDLPALGDDTFALGTRHWRAHEQTLQLEGDAPRIAIGVVADSGGAAPRTLAALGRLRSRLDHANVDLVLALGGMGTTRAALEASLGVLADRASFAIVALPGDLEPVPALVAAIASLRMRGKYVIDGRLARMIELPGVTIATLAGAGARGRLVAGDDGCMWATEDVSHVFARFADHPGLRIVATSEAPRARDRGEPSGELALVPQHGQVDVIVHGPTRAMPSSARSGHRDGDASSLSPGSADASLHIDPSDVASAGILVIAGDAWSWQPILDTP